MNLDRVVVWEEKLGIRRTAVLAVTVWMTWRAFTWAAEYAAAVAVIASRVGGSNDLIAAAAMVAAVTAPVSLLQASVFKAYIESKA